MPELYGVVDWSPELLDLHQVLLDFVEVVSPFDVVGRTSQVVDGVGWGRVLVVPMLTVDLVNWTWENENACLVDYTLSNQGQAGGYGRICLFLPPPLEDHHF